MASKKDVQRELKNLQKRIKNVEAHTGFTFSVDEAYYMAQKNRKKAVNELKSLMRWKEADAGIKMGKHIKATAKGQLHYKYVHGDYETQLTQEDVKQFSRAINRYEKVNKKTIHPNVVGEKGKKAALEYVKKLDTPKKVIEHHNKMQANAVNNMKNKIAQAANTTGSPGLRALSKLINERDYLIAKYDKAKYQELTKLLDFNIYGSDDEDIAKIAGNIEDFSKAMLDYFGLTTEDFLKFLQDTGYNEDDIEAVKVDLNLWKIQWKIQKNT